MNIKSIAKMKPREFFYKLHKTIHNMVVMKNYSKIPYEEYCNRYFCYRRSKYSNQADYEKCDKTYFYFAARPNPGAGIGHQFANWTAGYWFSKLFGVSFAHIPFSYSSCPFVANEWDEFLNFGDNEIGYRDLISRGWKSVLLPLFEESEPSEVECIKKIMASYSGKKVVFLLEQDQFYRNQYDIIPDLQEKFYRKHAMDYPLTKYDKNITNIAIHIRRGDIVQRGEQKNPNLTMRWLDNEYYIKVLTQALRSVDGEYRVYIFSQGEEDDFLQFTEIQNTVFCLNMDERLTFLHFVFADILITSKSSFSYKAGLLNQKVKMCPANFWHGYPKGHDWILYDDYGNPV